MTSLQPLAARSDCRITLRAEYSLAPARSKLQNILPMAEPKISSIGKYRIIELVGEGAMGVVYRAQDSVLERTVAIKVMNESIARQEDLRKRFLHEAQAAGSLQHPNVVCIYDLGEVDGHLFIAMEFVQGVDLERLIELGEPLSLQARLDIIIDVLTGLAYAHKRGIVHRDIKPANIRVADDGRAKIMDFGVAHLASSSMTSTGSILGTPSYMAPEQITEGKTSPATDIFAVGGVLYQVLAQMKPFDAPTLQNLFFKIITEHPRPVTELMPGLPPALDRIVRKAMAKEPAERYASALDMANDLTNVRSKLSGPSYPASVSLSASVASAIEQSRKTSDIRTRKFAYIGAGALAAAAVLAIAWSQVSGPGSATLEAADKPAAVVTPPPSQLAVATITAGASTGSNAATPENRTAVVQAPPRQSPAGQELTAAAARQAAAHQAAARDARARAAKVPPKPVQSRVAGAPTTSTAVPPPTLATRQETVPSPPPSAVVSPAVVQAPKQEAPASAPAAPSAADIGPTVQAYAHAIESRDIGAIRRVYPGLTSNQQQRFEQFFQAARSINVTFTVTNVELSGASADARLGGTYEYVTTAGKAERQAVSFAATLRHDGNAWRLVSVR
jgi:serine/threonine protein kinase